MLLENEKTGFLIEDYLTVGAVHEVLFRIKKDGIKKIFISSPGGSGRIVFLGLDRLIPENVTMIGGEMVCSAALSFFLCGKRRVALEETIFNFHEAIAHVDGRNVLEGELQGLVEIRKINGENQSAIELSDLLRDLRCVNELTINILRNATTLSPERIHALMRGSGMTMSARQALRYGLIHEIIEVTKA